MDRFQLLIDKNTLAKVKKIARKKRVSANEIIRDAIYEKVSEGKPVRLRDAAEVLYEASIKHAVAGGPPDLSSNDDSLYKI